MQTRAREMRLPMFCGSGQRAQLAAQFVTCDAQT